MHDILIKMSFIQLPFEQVQKDTKTIQLTNLLAFKQIIQNIKEEIGLQVTVGRLNETCVRQALDPLY